MNRSYGVRHARWPPERRKVDAWPALHEPAATGLRPTSRQWPTLSIDLDNSDPLLGGVDVVGHGVWCHPCGSSRCVSPGVTEVTSTKSLSLVILDDLSHTYGHAPWHQLFTEAHAARAKPTDAGQRWLPAGRLCRNQPRLGPARPAVRAAAHRPLQPLATRQVPAAEPPRCRRRPAA